MDEREYPLPGLRMLTLGMLAASALSLQFGAQTTILSGTLGGLTAFLWVLFFSGRGLKEIPPLAVYGFFECYFYWREEARSLKAKLYEVAHYLAVLAETPERLAECAAGLGDERIDASPALGDWSLGQLLAHLRAAAEVWGESIYAMLEAEHPDLPYVHPNQRMKSAGYAAVDFQVSLQAYTEQRLALLEMLRQLQPEEWSREALIRGRRHTVFSQARRVALHEADHWAQIERMGEQR